MAYRRISPEQRKRLEERSDAENEIVDRELRNRKHIYYKTPFFITSLALRFLFIIFFSLLFFTNGGSNSVITEEVVTEFDKGPYVSGSVEHQTVHSSKIVFKTSKDSYEAYAENFVLPDLYIGDTLLVGYNIFGKAKSFSRKSFAETYKLALNWILYGVIGIITVMSFTFNEPGLSERKFLWVTLIANLFAFLHYFVS